MTTLNGGAERFLSQQIMVIGASAGGIGGAVAERFAREGADLWLASPQEPEKLLKQLHRITSSVCWIQCDITDTASMKETAARVQREAGSIHGFVNNAGVESCELLESMSDEQISEQLEVNLHGAIRITKYLLPTIMSPGFIVHIGSMLGLAGCPGFATYSAAKAGLAGFVRSLALELSERRIRVNVVAPALVHSPMTHKHAHIWNAEVETQIQRSHPLGIGMTHDVAATVAFLASEDARWITGIVLPLGWTPNYPIPESFIRDT